MHPLLLNHKAKVMIVIINRNAYDRFLAVLQRRGNLLALVKDQQVVAGEEFEEFLFVLGLGLVGGADLEFGDGVEEEEVGLEGLEEGGHVEGVDDVLHERLGFLGVFAELESV